MGFEITLERFLNKGFYYLITSSLFDSKYKGSDKIERNTAFNTNYIFNVLTGKEFKIGRSKQNTFGIDFRTTYMGGKRYIPIDYDATEDQNQVVYNYNDAYINKHKDYFRMDVKLSYNVNRAKVSHQFILDLQNISNQQNLFKEQYNVSTGEFTYEYQQGFMPNIQYRILF